ncbi:MAG: hypothetical protein BWY43_00806 [candidate division WS2 bacterium ADurb.Bin280]|uniref:Uncharacterized protein n=1 Tax=candidate division WS2 bacterium ADurb.Bin280 TaxID=1852829 RepID=A0A1V5SB83_9BACT|nr:MAG: hypothetical protein BWY43_00806 [candidate division WS2 bacterium ADurb.Bin280]
MGRGHKEHPNLFSPTPRTPEEEKGKRFSPTVHGGMEREDFKGYFDDINTVAHEGVVRTSMDQKGKHEENDAGALEEVRKRIDAI